LGVRGRLIEVERVVWLYKHTRVEKELVGYLPSLLLTMRINN